MDTKQIAAEIKSLHNSWNKVLMQDKSLYVWIRLTGSQGMLTKCNTEKNVLSRYKQLHVY